MKFTKIVLGFIPFFATAQVDLQAVGTCPETSYSFFRQDVKEQEFTKTYDKQGRILKQTNNFSSKNTGNYTEEYTYEYDAAGNNTTITYKRNGEIKKVTKKNFDANGQLLQESVSGGVNL
ncbi:MAG: RHS repeat domain-containing protein, partial [Emticicia sp.]